MVLKTKENDAEYEVGDTVLVSGDLFDQVEEWQKFQGFGRYCDTSPPPDTCFLASKVMKINKHIISLKFLYDATSESVNKKHIFRKATDVEVAGCVGEPMYVFRTDGEKHPFKGVFWLKGGDYDPDPPLAYVSGAVVEGESAKWKRDESSAGEDNRRTPSAEEVELSDSSSINEVHVSPVIDEDPYLSTLITARRQMLHDLNEEIKKKEKRKVVDPDPVVSKKKKKAVGPTLLTPSREKAVELVDGSDNDEEAGSEGTCDWNTDEEEEKESDHEEITQKWQASDAAKKDAEKDIYFRKYLNAKWEVPSHRDSVYSFLKVPFKNLTSGWIYQVGLHI